MHILMISDVYFPRVNGVSTSILSFRRSLEAQGHCVTLVCPDYGQRAETDTRIIRIPARTLVVDKEDRMMQYRTLCRRLEQEIARARCDVIHIQTPFIAHYAGVKVARRYNIPCVESYHTFFEEYLHHYLPLLPRALMRLAARRISATQCNDVDALITPSIAMAEVLRRYGVNKPTSIIPTGLRMENFENADGLRFRRRYGVDPERPTLVHIGRIAFEKNIAFLIDVLAAVKAQISDVLLIIAGEGPALRRLQRKIAGLDLQNNVLFVGYLDRNNVLLDCYRAGDVFIFASRTETQGLVLLEAMALGVPVVSTAVMGTKDILLDEMGAVIAEENVEDFSAKLVGLLRDRDLRQLLGHEAKRFARRWSEEHFTERLIDLYDSLRVTGSDYPVMVSPRSAADYRVD